MEPFSLHVKEVRQTSSGGDYIVWYTASVELRDADTAVAVLVDSCYPANADAKLVEIAAASIRAGFLRVLEPMRMGASIHLSRLVIHDVDFRPRMFEEHTAEHFKRALEERLQKA
jgi:hypothetical protein